MTEAVYTRVDQTIISLDVAVVHLSIASALETAEC